MSHPVRTPPHHHLHQQQHHHHLNRIDEDPQEQEGTPPSLDTNSSLSINSEWFRTPPSSGAVRQDTDVSGFSDSFSINGNTTTGAIDHHHHQNDDDDQVLLPSTQLANKAMLQRKLRFYFMSPIDKWRIKRRFPLKLLFQLVKIILVTAHIMTFGNEMSDYLNYEDNTRTGKKGRVDVTKN